MNVLPTQVGDQGGIKGQNIPITHIGQDGWFLVGIFVNYELGEELFEFVLELDVICFFKGADFIILAFKVGSHEDLLEVIDFVFSHDEDVVFVLNLPNKVYGLIIDGEVETN